ncbi:MAG: hypothetical protein ACT4PO_11740 [Actinomycetota bacterium]
MDRSARRGTAAGVISGDEAQPPRWVRRSVPAFLAAFVVCGLAGIEAWPLSGFRLFSHLRYEHQVSWEAATVGPDGTESPIRFGLLPRAHRGFVLVMRDFPAASPQEKDAACRAWADAVRRTGRAVVAVRIYQIEWDLLPREEARAASPVKRTLLDTCADDRATAGPLEEADAAS